MSFKQSVFGVIKSAPEKNWPGQFFDGLVAVLIVLSVIAVFAVTFNLPDDWMRRLSVFEKVASYIFLAEYAIRFWTADLQYPQEKGWLRARIRYVLSASAIIDLIAILPLVLGHFLPEGLLGIRVLRLVRLSRVFKLGHYFDALVLMGDVLKDKAKELIVLLFFMSMMVSFVSLLIYSVEHEVQPENFPNALSALLWSVEVFTKSGNRGVVPVTMMGRGLVAFLSVLGVALVALPTGIITAGMNERLKRRRTESAPCKEPSDTGAGQEEGNHVSRSSLDRLE